MIKSLVKRLAYSIVERDANHYPVLPSDYVRSLEYEVCMYVKMMPGLRCYEIDKSMGLNTHHQWVTKGILKQLERKGKIRIEYKGRYPRYY